MKKNKLRQLAGALAVLMGAGLAGCGATAQATAGDAVKYLPEETTATAETAAGQTLLNGVTVEEYLAAQAICEQLSQQLGFTAETASPAVSARQAALNRFCAAQPGSISVWLQDLTTGEVLSYNAGTLYYGASTLKTPYALWLCRQADAGDLDLNGTIPNTHLGTLADSALAAYNASETVPISAAITAMISESDNDATDLLMAAYPGTADTGYTDFLAALGYADAAAITMTTAEGVQGYTSAAEAGATMRALYAYLQTGTAGSNLLRQAFTGADHALLYVPAGVAAAKKYGSWDHAFHDEMIVYDAKPYLLCCFTDWGDTEVDFPPEAVARMQQLGKLASAWMEVEGIT